MYASATKSLFSVYEKQQTFLAFVGDTNRLSCKSQGIPQTGLQIVCVVAIYVNENKRRRASKDARNCKSPTVDSLSAQLNHNRPKQQGQHFISLTRLAEAYPLLFEEGLCHGLSMRVFN